MPLFRKKAPVDGFARLSYASRDDEIVGVWPEWDGDEALLLQLPGMVWDEYLAYVRGGTQEALEVFRVPLSLLAGSWREDPANLLMGALPFLTAQPDQPSAVTTVLARMDYANQRLWTEGLHEPKIDRDLLFTLYPQVVWDWVFRRLLDAEAHDEIYAVLTNLDYQADYYDTRGVAGDFFLRNLGKAPFFGAMSGNRDRLIGEIAAQAGISVDDFETLPSDERDRIVASYPARPIDELIGEITEFLAKRDSDATS